MVRVFVLDEDERRTCSIPLAFDLISFVNLSGGGGGREGEKRYPLAVVHVVRMKLRSYDA